MASTQPIRNHCNPQHGQATSATSGSDYDVVGYTMKEMPSYENEESADQEQLVTVSAVEYAVFLRAYQLIDKHYGQLPEYRDISQKFKDRVILASLNHGRITWTSFFQAGQACSYMEALHEMTHLLATMMLDAREDRDDMRDIVRLIYDAVNLRRTFGVLDQSDRLIIRKWEHMRDTLMENC